MYLIAITGGIASGKTTVAKHLECLGALRIDADQVAKDVVEPGEPALAELRKAFGDGIFSADGSLNRQALGELVFGDPQALSTLNAIVHPRVRERSEQMFDQASAAGHSVVLYDVPLLAESKRPLSFDMIVTVEAGPANQLDRLINIRGMAEVQARSRIAAQATEEERRALAHTVIDSSGTLDETIAQTDELWKQIQSTLKSAE